MKHRFVKAGWLWKRVLPKMGLVAIVMPWRTIYVLAPWFNDAVIRLHELVHIEQIGRDGPIVFAVKYLWWLIVYGYRNNPYEVEAYARDGRP